MKPAPKMDWFQKYIIVPIAVVLMAVSWYVLEILMLIPFVPVTLLKFASGNSFMDWEEWKEFIAEPWADLF